ncbi:hypothetical protein [Achromobacter ruhlandii]|uniref:PBCV-specific basic adaptor domain-containing protein n=1 Tax=Achromobacter ruhlandii TaxID=72557 RepID=A0A2M9H171_9BURK|nr:hypothetical protein [Achromobacter ruhlandii]PJM70562.1 hypothetical protein CV751_10125 [Achromobacter ruhlandii]CAB3837272.1 hypothetical protein LMG3328_01080 [Achromobacter ruhlandii]
MRALILALAALAVSFATAAHSANTPCSGKKGGVERCVGEKFLCRDGSISASKRVCTGPDGGAQSLVSPPPAAGSSGSCHCRDGQYCTGPRGGTFCYSDSGKKSYLRK